ncbi:MAG: glycosyltransferase family 4 protein [Cyclobacteriaceae bacterium]
MSRKPVVLFYHAHFFNDSETFIYQQARNPHIITLLLSKRFFNDDKFDFSGLGKFRFKRSLWDGLLSNLVSVIGIDRYYFGSSVNNMERMFRDQPFDVLHAQFGFSAVRILPLARQMKKPLVVSFHGFDASRLLRKRSYRLALQKVFDYASAIVICNPLMAEALPLKSDQLPKVHWVPYGIDLNRFTRSARAQADKVHLLHVGRLIEKKGVPDLVKVFLDLRKKYDWIELHVVGNGPDEGECRRLAQTPGYENAVIFHGWKAPGEVKQLMEESHIFVLNSRVASDGDQEGLPNGILEAMAMEMAVVSTRHAGIPEAIQHRQEGLLVQERDNEALGTAIEELILQPDLRLKMGVAARKKVQGKFTAEAMHLRLADIYRSVTR